MARPRFEDVRRPIVRATFDCVARKGVSGMSVREVARITGLSTGTVTHHFGTRRELLLRAIEYGFEHLRPEFTALEPATALGWIIQQYDLSQQVRRTWWQFWLAVTVEAPTNPTVAEQMRQQLDAITDRWRTGLDAVGTDRLSADVDLATAARQLATFGNGLIIDQLIDPSCSARAVIELKRRVEDLGVPRAALESKSISQ